MKSSLLIKDLSNSKELDREEMSAVRGGVNNQANGTNQGNILSAFAPMAVANGAVFSGSGPVIIQADSHVDQTAHNDSSSENYKDAYGWFFG